VNFARMGTNSINDISGYSITQFEFGKAVGLATLAKITKLSAIRDLPMPGSPANSTTRPSPNLA
jgi:hypothetical protein